MDADPRKVTVYMDEEQFKKLSDDARESGMRFFDFCRSKLLDDARMWFLTEEEYEVVAAKAASKGLSIYDYARAMLLPLGLPKEKERALLDNAARFATVKRSDVVAAVAKVDEARPPKTAQPDRIDRLEAIVMQMADAINNLANAQPVVEAAPAAPVDDDDVVNQALEAADRYGVAVDREQAAVSSGGIRPVGQRMVSRLAVGQVPSHVAGLFPT